MLQLNLIDVPDEFTNKIKQAMDSLSAKFPKINAEANLKIIQPSAMQELNLKYSGEDYATDVLSFPYPAVDGGELGDIVINQAKLDEQAKDAGITRSDEAALLALHGVLHLLGYDHQTEEDQRRLGRLQQEILTDAGIASREFIWQPQY